MASLSFVRGESRKWTFKHPPRYALAFVFGFKRGLELITLTLWVIAGFVPLWSVHRCCVCLSFGMNLPACFQSVWPVTIDLSAISLLFASRDIYCSARFPISSVHRGRRGVKKKNQGCSNNGMKIKENNLLAMLAAWLCEVSPCRPVHHLKWLNNYWMDWNIV